MHEFVSLNSNLNPAKDAAIPAFSSAALYGKGVFTTVAIYDGKPFLWEKHWRRLERDTEKLKIEIIGFSEITTQESLAELIQNNNVTSGRPRITFVDESASEIWPVKAGRKTSLLITTGDFRSVSDNVRLTVSPYRLNSLSPLAGIKSCNYLEKIIALDEAKARGFDEAIQLNERGDVTSASMANVFWLKDEVLYTPSLKTGCLPGTTREFVKENIECREGETGVDVLNTADAIFLTSVGLGVVQVAEFESKKPERTRHPILDLLS